MNLPPHRREIEAQCHLRRQPTCVLSGSVAPRKKSNLFKRNPGDVDFTDESTSASKRDRSRASPTLSAHPRTPGQSRRGLNKVGMFFVSAIEGEYLHATVHYLQDAEAASALERYKQPFLEHKYCWPSTRVPLVRSEAEQQTTGRGSFVKKSEYAWYHLFCCQHPSALVCDIASRVDWIYHRSEPGPNGFL